MSNIERFYPESHFGGFTDIDGTIAFFSRIHALVDSTSVVLDVGCGRGAYDDDTIPFRRNLRILQGSVSKVIGIDVDPNAQANRFLDEFKLLTGERWPIDDNSVDLLICDSVIEHVPNPAVLFAEMARVLKKGGYVCARTPNRWNYVALAATLIPNKHHSTVTTFAQDDRKEEDVFPTLYRCNTVGKIRKMLKKNGFTHAVYGYEAEPSYLSFSRFAYALGVLHQRFAPRFLKPMIFIFGQLQK